MKNKILLLFISLSLLTSLACKTKKEVKLQEQVQNQKNAHEVLPPDEAVKGESIYQLKVNGKDSETKVTPLSIYEGHPVVVSMFYATCPYSCPVLIDRLKLFEKNLDENTKKDVRFLLISFDPENDTPQELQKLMQKYHLDASRWKLLQTEENQVREIAAVLGIKYRKTQDGGFNHSSLITILDKEGKIQMQYETGKFSAEEAVKDLKKIGF